MTYGAIDEGISPEPACCPISESFDALHFARLLASIAMCYNHFHGTVATPRLRYASAGVSFFFALAGFGPAISKLRRAWPATGPLEICPSPHTYLRRLSSVYPMYLFALVSMVLLKPEQWQFPDWHLAREVLMLQDWKVAWPDQLSYAPFLWFVSALAFFWLLEEATFTAAAALWRSDRPVTYSFMLFVSYIGLSPFSQIGVLVHMWPAAKVITDCPLEYYHQYAIGVAVAFVVRQRALDKVPATAWYASAALVALCAFICIEPALIFGESWFTSMELWVKRVGILVPLFCVLILGLAEGHDPAARLFASAPFVWAKPVAFGVYAMQLTIVTILVKLRIVEDSHYFDGQKAARWPKISISDVTFFVMPVTLLVAYFVQTYVQDPGAEVILSLAKRVPANKKQETSQSGLSGGSPQDPARAERGAIV